MQILVPPPHFWLVLPHFVCSGDGTATGSLFQNFSSSQIYAMILPFDEF